MKNDFVHLHVHSEYSLLDGACRISELVNRAKTLKMNSLALTDHGNMFGAIKFYEYAKENGIKPIIGFETYVTPGSRMKKEGGKGDLYHITLLAENNDGYRNLLKLATSSYLEGFYYKPRVDKEILSQHSNGIICLSGCMQSEINQNFLKGNRAKAYASANQYKDIFGVENFFLELQDNNIEGQGDLVKQGLIMGNELGLQTVVTNDVHYMNPEDSYAHDVLLCINTGKTLHESNRMRFTSNEFYFKTKRQMEENFREIPDALSNTLRISDRCNVDLRFDQMHLPRFVISEEFGCYKPGMTNAQFLREVCRQGAIKKYKTIDSVIEERLNHELKVIEETGFVDYFLIVWDFIDYANKLHIPATGRGSGAGSLVAYVLGITNVDPIKYDLLFERFLNAERISMPDLDIDFCAEGREKVIQYVRKRYGGDSNVAQIITFGRMKAKGVIRDVGRVMNIPLFVVDKVAKLIPPTLGITLKEALTQEPELKSLYENDKQIKELFDVSAKLEGLCRHASTHAAGVVVSDEPLTNYVPLAKNGDVVTTQFDDVTLVEKLGLLKADFLGVRKLSVIDKALKLIKKITGKDITVDDIPLDDEKTYSLLARGEVKGIFQVETSSGFRDLLMRLKPEKFEDILPLVALYRPGPLLSGMVDSFINCRHGKEEISYIHPKLEPIIKETYGVILYQEQVMRIANKLAGFSLNEADNLRKAMGKKKPEVMAKFKKQFIDGAVQRDISVEIAEKIFELMEYFAGYGFNKSHSAAYAMICYQTAYLKANYPTEYMAAQMTCEKQNNEKIVNYMNECRRMGIEVLPPSINKSYSDFTMVSENKILCGLGVIKNVGEKAIESIISARKTDGKFSSIYDFCERIDLRLVNKQVIESLIKAGCFSELPGHGAQFLEGIETLLQLGNRLNRDRRMGQMTLFDTKNHDSGSNEYHHLPDTKRWSEKELLKAEKEALGFYVSSHPLRRYEGLIKRLSNTSTGNLAERSDGDEIFLGGILDSIKITTTKKGAPIAYFSIEDIEGVVKCVLFKDNLSSLKDLLQTDEVVFIKGNVSFRDTEPSIRVENIVLAKDVEKSTENSPSRDATITLKYSQINDTLLLRLKDILLNNKGQCPVFIEFEIPSREVVKIKTSEKYSVTLTEKVRTELGDLIGEGCVVC